MCAVDPSCTQNYVFGKQFAHCSVSCLLACPVYPERVDWVVFGIGAALATVEHIIRRDMDQRDAKSPTGQGKVGGTSAICGPSSIAVAFGAVDARIGRGIDNDIGPPPGHGGADGLGLRDIKPCAVEGSNLPSGWPATPGKLAADLPTRPEHHHLHRGHASDTGNR